MDPLGRPGSGVSPGRRQGGDDSFALLLGNGRRRLVQRVNRTAPDNNHDYDICSNRKATIKNALWQKQEYVFLIESCATKPLSVVVRIVMIRIMGALIWAKHMC